MAETANIPVIDISADGEGRQQVAKELVEAAVSHGFIYIKDTGKDIPVESVDAAFEMARTLFASPEEEKQKCSIQQNNMGWSASQVEILDPKNQKVGDNKESFNFGEFPNGKAQQPLPPSIHPYEARIAAFRAHCTALSLKLLQLLGEGLDVRPPSYFADVHQPARGPSGTVLRVLFYPPLSQPSAAAETRAAAHSDYGSLTLLFRLRGQPGLEVRGPNGGPWMPVPVCPPGTEADAGPPVLVNIGDLLSYWTNGLLRSTLHRVVLPAGAEARYSIAFFCHPAGATRLEAVPSDRVRAYKKPEMGVGEDEDLRRESVVMTADEHLQMRLKETYSHLYGGKA